MSAMKKERTPEQIEAAKARMAAVRAKRGLKPKSLLKEGHRNADPVQLSKEDLESGVFDVPKRWAKPKYGVSPAISSGGLEEVKRDNASALKKLREVEHKRSTSLPDEFEGITANDCCTACRPDRCVISGAAHCIHPCKGGIQSAYQMRPDVVERYNRAKKILAHAKIDLS